LDFRLRIYNININFKYLVFFSIIYIKFFLILGILDHFSSI
jgi:hypothetical protein